MPASSDLPALGHQAQFHQRWNHLHDPHVRTLAWLLDAPELLDVHAEEWRGRIATLGPIDPATADWLAALDREPQQLHAWLDLQPFTRLGRYAEKLLAYFLEYRKLLVAHGVQVRAEGGETIGEFDFLVRYHDKELVHWEFATKLYLLESSGHGRHADYFVGPNLADTLGAKIRKIMDRQLLLAQHPAAQSHLPQPVAFAQALVKGWLFYHGKTPEFAQPPGVSPMHCCGFWLALEETESLAGECYAILPRLSWLAPAKLESDSVMDKATLRQTLASYFDESTMPVLVALLEQRGSRLLEVDRGFIVPDDWHSRAERRVVHNS